MILARYELSLYGFLWRSISRREPPPPTPPVSPFPHDHIRTFLYSRLHSQQVDDVQYKATAQFKRTWPIGSHDGTIYLRVGRAFTTSVRSSTTTFPLRHFNHLADGVTGDGQLFCVTNHTMYIMDPAPNSHLSIFDLKTATYSANWHNEAIPRPGGGGGSCLTSSDTLLFVLGGVQASKSLQTLSLDRRRWYIDTLDMQHSRTTYAIGGNEPKQASDLDSVEYASSSKMAVRRQKHQRGSVRAQCCTRRTLWWWEGSTGVTAASSGTRWTWCVQVIDTDSGQVSDWPFRWRARRRWWWALWSTPLAALTMARRSTRGSLPR